MMETTELEKEWMEKIDIFTGKLKSDLSNECYEWAKVNNQRTEVLTIELFRRELWQVYEDIILFLGEWIDIPDEYKKIMAIWIIGTYFHKEFDTYPYLYINASKASGKTRLLRIISYLQKNGNGEVLNNPSESAMFRTAKEKGLIIDEFESEKSKDKQMMREIINSCYKKDGVVVRMERQKVDGKEKMVAIPHVLFTPIAMANINGIDEVLGDRAITLTLEKSDNPLLVKKIEDFSRNPKIKEIKRTLEKVSVGLCSVYPLQKGIDAWNSYVIGRYTTYIQYIHTIHNYTQPYIDDKFFERVDNTGILGRNLELFFPLIMLSKLSSEEVFDDLIKIISSLNLIKKEDDFNESKDVVVYEFVSLADRYRFDYVFAHELFRQFKEFLGNFGEDEESRWINLTWFGVALKRLRLISDKKRVAKGQMILLNIDKAKEKLKIFKT